MSWEGQFDFGSRGGTAPDFEARADPLRPLAHARKPPVSVAPGSKYFGVDPAAVVAHEYAQVVVRILHLDLDVLGFGVAERVD
jgi:hypothetical protein